MAHITRTRWYAVAARAIFFRCGSPRWARSKYARTVGDRRCACQAASATSWRTTGALSRVMCPSRTL
jgi:hypothetical protein